MAFSIASLVVSLVGKTGGFEESMKRAAKTTTSLKQKMSETGSSVSGFGNKLLGLAAGGGFAYLLAKQSESVDSTNKLSRTLGIAASDLVAIAHAADLSGVSFEQVTTGIGRMQKFLLEAVNNSGGNASRLLKSLKLDPKALLTQPAIDSFYEVGGAIAKVGSDSLRNALQLSVFGRSARDLFNIFEGGRASLEDARKEVQETGNAFNSIEGTQVENANDAVTRLSFAVKGLFTQLVIRLAPGLEFVSNKLRELIVSGEAFSFVNQGFSTAIMYMARMMDAVSALRAVWEGLKFSIAKVLEFTARTADLIGNLIVDIINKALSAISFLAQKVVPESLKDALPKTFQDLVDGNLKLPPPDISGFAESFSDFAEDAKMNMGDAIGAFVNGNAATAASEFLVTMTEGSKRLAESMQSGAKSAASIAEQSEGIFSGMDSKNKSLGTATARAIDLARTALGGVQTTSRPQKVTAPQFDKMVSLLQQVASNTESIDGAGAYAG